MTFSKLSTTTLFFALIVLFVCIRMILYVFFEEGLDQINHITHYQLSNYRSYREPFSSKLANSTTFTQLINIPSNKLVDSHNFQYSSHPPSEGLLLNKKDHRILTLNDIQLKSTPINEMMSWYGEANGGGSCADDFGNSLVNRWRNTKKLNCEGYKNKRSKFSSDINCYLVKQTRHFGNGDNLCQMSNMSINLSYFNQESDTRKVIETYVKTKHFKQPYLSFPAGFIQGSCTPLTNVFKTDFMPGWNADLTVNAFTSIPSNEDINNYCTEWVSHNVLIVQRDTFANFFHDSEDFINVFLAMAILEWKPSNTQIYLTDLYPKGPFWNMWSDVYSHGLPALTAWDIKQLYATKQKHGRICFKSVAVGIYGPAAPITVASWDTPCSRTALVRAYADYVVRSLNLHENTHYAQSKPNRTIVVTYMSRRASSHWPEEKFCNSTHSFFICDYWKDFGPRQLGRTIENDKEVVESLASLTKEVNLHTQSDVKIVVQDVDYNKLNFREQIKIDLETDIMIGPHGAGLMHSVFLRDRGALIELFIDGSQVNRHFHNLANWAGKKYYERGMNNPVSINELLDLVRGAIRLINIDTY